MFMIHYDFPRKYNEFGEREFSDAGEALGEWSMDYDQRVTGLIQRVHPGTFTHTQLSEKREQKER